MKQKSATKRSPRSSSARVKAKRATGRLSLYPLTFDEAVTDILKVKPEPKTKRKK